MIKIRPAEKGTKIIYKTLVRFGSFTSENFEAGNPLAGHEEMNPSRIAKNAL